MFERRLQISSAILAGLSLLCAVSPAPAQFGFSVVTDPTQEAHSWQQILNDIQKLQKLDQQIQVAYAMSMQLQNSAKFFSNKTSWRGLGNQIVRNWAPNAYGVTPAWNSAVLFGTGAPGAWQTSTIGLQTNSYLAQIAGAVIAGGRGYNPYARQVQYAGTVEVFDGAGPTALQTLGNARMQQTQMASSIANLQAAATDTSAGTNSEVEQLNLLTAGTVQGLEMQQTSNNVLTSLLEQQTIANKIQRDTMADHLDFENQVDQYLVSESPQWGGASTALQAH